MLYHRRSESTSICRTNDVILICHVIWRHLSFLLGLTTGSPRSKYEHPRTSALLRNIRNIRICMGKKPIVSVTYENERISIKKQLTLLRMCVKSLLCGRRADLSPFYGFWCKRFSLYIKVYREIPSATKLLVECPRTSKFYLLPKIHKPGNPGRPIVSACSCPTEKLALCLDKVTAPFVRGLESYVKDITHMLNILDSFRFSNDRGQRLVFTMDIKSLYTVIPQWWRSGVAEIFPRQEGGQRPTNWYSCSHGWIGADPQHFWV